MTDIHAAIGLVEIERYDSEMLPRRKYIFDTYYKAFSKYSWAKLTPYEEQNRISSYHVFTLRINGIDEAQRDAIMQKIFEREVSVNVHFIPLPMMSFYKSLGYKIENYPQAYNNFKCEISLPVYFDLNDQMLETVIDAVVKSVEEVIV
jgi:dTDP-4-amino-4,6-dideoxygalactose transaminase